MADDDKSLAVTPTWAVATIITIFVSISFLIQGSLELSGKWLNRTRRKALSSALEKIKDELMLFGVLSLLMGHFAIWVSKICVKTSVLSTRFYPCIMDGYSVTKATLNASGFHEGRHEYCSKGREPFASYESLEQLHRLLFVLGIVHVSYNFASIALAMVKIISWRSWESQAHSMYAEAEQGASSKSITRLTTFTFHRTSHPWNHNKVLAWMLCFSRQFWSSINRADYMALRLGFITNHELPLSYDFHSYMLRSLEDEFRDIVGISLPLWIYAILCIFLNFHGTNIYFWLSFTPAVLILLVGTKLHHVVLKLALEVTENNEFAENHFNLRDDLFWFGKPKLLLRLIQLISFQNAFEMATFLWSLWEIGGPSCFMQNRVYVVIRLTCGVVFQFWCSNITFPLYVIITQMGSKFKKSVVTERVRESLTAWRIRAKKSRRGRSHALTTKNFGSLGSEAARYTNVTAYSTPHSSSRFRNGSSSHQSVYVVEDEIRELDPSNDDSDSLPDSGTHYDSLGNSEDDNDADELALFSRQEGL